MKTYEPPIQRSTHLGWDCGRFGLSITLNPYKPGSTKWKLWNKTWKEGTQRLEGQREEVILRCKELERQLRKETRNSSGAGKAKG